MPSAWNLAGFEKNKFSACFLATCGSVRLFPCNEFCAGGNGWWLGGAMSGGGSQPSLCRFVWVAGETCGLALSCWGAALFLFTASF